VVREEGEDGVGGSTRILDEGESVVVLRFLSCF